MSTSARIVIVGAGIIGASIAQALSREGARIVLVDRTHPVTGTSRASFAWINAFTANGDAYFKLRAEGLLEYRRLEERLRGSLHMRWGGSLTWDKPIDVLQGRIAKLSATGFPVRGIDRVEFRTLEPHWQEPPEFAAYCESEASIDCEVATLALLAAARSNGVTTCFDVDVVGLETHSGTVTNVTTNQGTVKADFVVIAAGAGAQSLCASVGARIPLETFDDVLVYSAPVSEVLTRVVNAPSFHAKQQFDGRIVAGGDLPEDRELRFTDSYGGRLLDRVGAQLFVGAGLRLFESRTSQRVVPQDGMPIVGRIPGIANLYVAVTHSGVTLAPLIGRIVAGEIMRDSAHSLPAAFRPERFVASGIA